MAARAIAALRVGILVFLCSHAGGVVTDRMNIAAQFYEGGLPPKDMDAAIHKLGALLWGQQAWADERRAWWERAARAEFRLGAGVTATVRYGARDGLSKRMIAEQEHDAYNITRRGLRASDVFLDVGGHIGLTALRAALTTGVGRVVTLEPSRANYVFLVYNLWANGLPLARVAPMRGALSPARGENATVAFVTNEFDTSGGSAMLSRGSSELLGAEKGFPDLEERVPAAALDALVGAARRAGGGGGGGGAPLAFLKLDCEGCECVVVPSLPARFLVESVRVLAGEVHPWVLKNRRGAVQDDARRAAMLEKVTLGRLCEFVRARSEQARVPVEMRELRILGKRVTTYDVAPVDKLRNCQKMDDRGLAAAVEALRAYDAQLRLETHGAATVADARPMAAAPPTPPVDSTPAATVTPARLPAAQPRVETLEAALAAARETTARLELALATAQAENLALRVQ